MEKKQNRLIGIVICGIFTLFGIVTSIISLVNGSYGIWMLNDAVNIAMVALIVYYVIHNYRKPHGNLLKYLVLLFAATYLASVYNTAQLGRGVMSVISMVEVGLLCYIAGRLHKVKQNTPLIIIITVSMLFRCVRGFATGNATIAIFTPLIIWLDICVAYFLRYKEHKEAGLADAPKA